MQLDKEGYVIIHKDLMLFVASIRKIGKQSLQFLLTEHIDDVLVFGSVYEACRAIQDVDDSENYEIAKYSKSININKKLDDEEIKTILQFSEFTETLSNLDRIVKRSEGSE